MPASETQNSTTPEPLSANKWGKLVKDLASKVHEVMAEVTLAEISTARAALRAGGVLAEAQVAFRSQGLNDEFMDWAQTQTGKSGSWISSRIQAAKVVVTLPEVRQAKDTPLEDLAALHRVGSHEVRESILADVRDRQHLSGVAATKAIRKAADEYLLEKNPDRANRKLEREKSRDEKKATEMRDGMRSKVARIVATATKNGTAIDDIRNLLVAGCAIGEKYGEGSRAALVAVLKDKGTSDVEGIVASDDTDQMVEDLVNAA